MDLGHWELADGVTLPEDFEENPPMGFVYRIENKETKKFYIGQKKIIKVEKRPPLKGKVRKRKIIKQSDWRTYCGSSNDLKADVKALGEDKFKFEIIKFCDCKWLMTYWELYYQMMNHVLFREDSYNGIINVRISKFQKFIDMYQQENQNLDNIINNE
jgi:hypothetical protein